MSGLNKNILEIVLDKDKRGEYVFSDVDNVYIVEKSWRHMGHSRNVYSWG